MSAGSREAGDGAGALLLGAVFFLVCRDRVGELGAVELGTEAGGVACLAPHTTTVSVPRSDMLFLCFSDSDCSTRFVASRAVLDAVRDVVVGGVFVWSLTTLTEEAALVSEEAFLALVATEEELVFTEETDDETLTLVSREVALVSFCTETLVLLTLVSCEMAATDDVTDMGS